MADEEILGDHRQLSAEDVREALRFAAAVVNERTLPLAVGSMSKPALGWGQASPPPTTGVDIPIPLNTIREILEQDAEEGVEELGERLDELQDA